MSHEKTFLRIRSALAKVRDQLDQWFDVKPELFNYRCPQGGWTVAEILEHISLTNRYLLLTLTKHLALAERRAARGVVPPEQESDLGKLEAIGIRGSFAWDRPDHMEPSGIASSEEIRSLLQQQFNECRDVLARAKNGIGALATLKMSVNDLGKIDLYQWLYFLLQHAKRHLQQMAAIRREFSKESNSGPID